MIEEIEFRFEQDVTEYPNRLSITAFDALGGCLLDEECQSGSSVAFVVDPLLDADRILNGNQTDLFKGIESLRLISTDSEKDSSIELDVLDQYTETSVLEEPIPIRKETLISGLIEFAEWYWEQLEKTDSDICGSTLLAVGIADARRRLAYYHEHGSLEGYQPTIDREHLETFLFECRSNDRLREFVAGTDDIAPFVRDLTRSEDDEYVEDAYRELFTERDDISRESLDTLLEHPDARVSLSIMGMALDSDPTFGVPALELLSQVDPGNLLEILSGRLKADEPEIVRTAIDGVASIDPDALDSDQRDYAVRRLEKAKGNIDDPSLQSRIDVALANLES